MDNMLLDNLSFFLKPNFIVFTDKLNSIEIKVTHILIFGE